MIQIILLIKTPDPTIKIFPITHDPTMYQNTLFTQTPLQNTRRNPKYRYRSALAQTTTQLKFSSRFSQSRSSTQTTNIFIHLFPMSFIFFFCVWSSLSFLFFPLIFTIISEYTNENIANDFFSFFFIRIGELKKKLFYLW